MPEPGQGQGEQRQKGRKQGRQEGQCSDGQCVQDNDAEGHPCEQVTAAGGRGARAGWLFSEVQLFVHAGGQDNHATHGFRGDQLHQRSGCRLLSLLVQRPSTLKPNAPEGAGVFAQGEDRSRRHRGSESQGAAQGTLRHVIGPHGAEGGHHLRVSAHGEDCLPRHSVPRSDNCRRSWRSDLQAGVGFHRLPVPVEEGRGAQRSCGGARCPARALVQAPEGPCRVHRSACRRPDAQVRLRSRSTPSSLA
mmetsp:Transcript_127791/g.284830  ORF Transcript_127791/g.284830 Transcript_127791/m.284830 type:complete len:248 (-) Transcript_127791:26-769(-)